VRQGGSIRNQGKLVRQGNFLNFFSFQLLKSLSLQPVSERLTE